MAAESVATKVRKDVTDELVQNILRRGEERRVQTSMALIHERITLLQWMNTSSKRRNAEIVRLRGEVARLDRCFDEVAAAQEA